ncbi:MAG: prepilin peptidase [Lachnospiraceae bacterium]|nr:prepilin peptidase [Lachnospiraceae bacterium]
MLFVLLLLLAAGAFFDARWRKIPNPLIALMLLSGTILCGASGAFVGMAAFWGRFFLSVLVLFPLYALRMFGAGDLKLIGCMVAFMGFARGATATFLGLVMVAVCGGAMLCLRGVLWERLAYFGRYALCVIQTKKLIPYDGLVEAGDKRGKRGIPMAPFLFLGAAAYVLYALVSGAGIPAAG